MTLVEQEQQTMRELIDFYGEPISVYTLQDAVDDGFMVDVTDQQSVYPCPVYISQGILELIETAIANKRHCNDFEGVLHDICWMSQTYLNGGEQGLSGFFIVKIIGTGRKQWQTIKRTRNSEGVTMCLPEED